MNTQERHAGRRRAGVRLWLAAAVGLLALPGAAAASHLDGQVFAFQSGPANPDYWCTNAAQLCGLSGNPIEEFATSSWSGRYLGTFGEETIYLNGMDYLGATAIYTNRAYLSFDLILTGDWGGNGFVANRPDFESLFKVVANGRTLLDSSFAGSPGYLQSYPATYPQGSNPAGTGSASFAAFFSVYHFDFMFSLGLPPNATCCADVDIRFSADFGPDWDLFPYEEFPTVSARWGLDNVVVSSTPIPEPASGVLLALGFLALAARRRRA